MQPTLVMLVVTPTANTPPMELVTVYARDKLDQELQADAVVAPLIATVGAC